MQSKHTNPKWLRCKPPFKVGPSSRLGGEIPGWVQTGLHCLLEARYPDGQMWTVQGYQTSLKSQTNITAPVPVELVVMKSHGFLPSIPPASPHCLMRCSRGRHHWTGLHLPLTPGGHPACLERKRCSKYLTHSPLEELINPNALNLHLIRMTESFRSGKNIKMESNYKPRTSKSH